MILMLHALGRWARTWFGDRPAPSIGPPSPLEPPVMETASPELNLDETRLHRLLAELGTELWRLRLKLLVPGSDEPRDGMAGPLRHADSMATALAEAGVVIHDHTGERFDAGLPLRSLHFEPTAGLLHATIVETMRPTIYLGAQRIQLGEVIVGTPPAAPEPPLDQPATELPSERVPS